MILAPLRGVTIRCFREVFAPELRSAGFDEAITPFISANAGYNPLIDRELAGGIAAANATGIKTTPQFIGKDPAALEIALKRIRDAGFDTADLNCGCPYPMIRAKGRGSGLLRTPDVLRRMLEVGCSVMGEGKFSAKTRLGIENPDELSGLMDIFNDYPLRFLTIHARTARQMYGGACDRRRFAQCVALSRNRVIENGDLPVIPAENRMVGRAFIVGLGERDDAEECLRRYVQASRQELGGGSGVLGRIKELVAYWRFLPEWSRRWSVLKLCRSVSEMEAVIGVNR